MHQFCLDLATICFVLAAIGLAYVATANARQ